MKTLSFKVELKFQDKIVTDDDIIEIGNKIADSLKQSADNVGLAPENSDTYTKEVNVSFGNWHWIRKII